MKLSDLKIIGTVCGDYIVIDYYEPPPTVELSNGRILCGETWDDEVKEDNKEAPSV